MKGFWVALLLFLGLNTLYAREGSEKPFLVTLDAEDTHAIMLTQKDIEQLNLGVDVEKGSTGETVLSETEEASPAVAASDWKIALWKKPLFADLVADPYSPSTQFALFVTTQKEVDQSNRVEFRPGYSISFLRLHPEDSVDLGAELFFYFALPMRMTADRFRMLSLDGVFGLGLGVSPANWLAFRLYRHHFSAHVGDELKDLTQSTLDYDSSMSSLNASYLRDEWGFSLALEPTQLFDAIPRELYARIYGEAFLATNGKDIFGGMYLVPAMDSPWWFQWGVEAAYSFRNPTYGGFFGALNVSYFQESGYTPNSSLVLGYQFPYSNSIETSIALTWYRGRARDLSFYMLHEEMWGVLVKLNM